MVDLTKISIRYMRSSCWFSDCAAKFFVNVQQVNDEQHFQTRNKTNIFRLDGSLTTQMFEKKGFTGSSYSTGWMPLMVFKDQRAREWNEQLQTILAYEHSWIHQIKGKILFLCSFVNTFQTFLRTDLRRWPHTLANWSLANWHDGETTGYLPTSCVNWSSVFEL